MGKREPPKTVICWCCGQSWPRPAPRTRLTRRSGCAGRVGRQSSGFPFSAGPTFAEACQERLAWIWQREAGPELPFPAGVEQLGWRKDNFSMRRRWPH